MKNNMTMQNPLWHKAMKAFQDEGMYDNLTIPFLLGIYKMKDEITDLSSSNCIRALLDEIINTCSEEEPIRIFPCGNTDEWVISINSLTYGCFTPLTNGMGRSIYTDAESLGIPKPTVDNVSEHFWGLYSENLQSGRFSKGQDGTWSDYSPEEKSVIDRIRHPE